MKRAVYIVAVVLLSGLAAFGAAELTLALGLGSEAATLAGLAALFGNVFMIGIVRKLSWPGPHGPF